MPARGGIYRYNALGRRLVALALGAGCAFWGGTARADMISGFLEWNYSLNNGRLTSGGETTRTKADTLTQRYNLNLNWQPYPQLRLLAGGLFKQDQSTVKATNQTSTTTDTTDTTIRPFADLTLENPLYNAGVGFNRREETLEVTAAPKLTTISEDYHALAGWKPEGLPWLDLQFSRFNNYDSDRTSLDSTTDRAIIGLRYLPVQSLDLWYQATYTDDINHLKQSEIEQLVHSGRATYTDQLFDGRLFIAADYNINHQEITATAPGKTEIDYPVSPSSAMFALNLTPQLGAMPIDATYSYLIDGNFTVGNSQVNLGVRGDTDRNINIGVTFVFAEAVDLFVISVDRDLPDSVANSFAWDVYTSTDNQEWTLVQAAVPGTFIRSAQNNRFEIRFPTVTTRYLKVVTSPLSAAVAAQSVPPLTNPESILVTEVQTYNRRPPDTFSQTTQLLNIDTKTRLLDIPALYYTLSFYYDRRDPAAETRYTVSNGLLLDHRFNDVFSLNARFAREDGQEDLGHRVAYIYDATLRATPLPALSHTLIYSGRKEDVGQTTNNSDSVFLYNTAELYRGIQLNLAGGITYATHENGDKTRTYSIIAGASIIPNSKVTINLTYSKDKTTALEGTSADIGSSIERADITGTYRPFTTLYLVAGVGYMKQQNSPADYTQNYGVNWSPFPDGTLQFNFSYSENQRTLNEEKTRTITPNLNWKITRRSFLQLAYVILQTKSATTTTDSEIYSMNLRTSF